MTNEKAIYILEGIANGTACLMPNMPSDGETAISMAIKALKADPHWIPVTEKLPEYGTEVVTYNRDEEFEINHIIDEEDGEWFLNGAIAWMPLPEPNKGVTK